MSQQRLASRTKRQHLQVLRTTFKQEDDSTCYQEEHRHQGNLAKGIVSPSRDILLR